MKCIRMLLALSLATFLTSAAVQAQWPSPCGDQGTWHSLTFDPYHNGLNLSAMESPYLLTDGRVMVQYVGTDPGAHQWQDWWTLTPDSSGSYINSTNWNQMASLYHLWPDDEYAPYGNASDVLADGRLLIQGGENNLGFHHVFSKEGAIYTPDSGMGSWAQLQPPGTGSSQWTCVGDAQSVILPDTNKTYMVAGCLDDDGQQALLNPSTMQWTILDDSNKLGSNSEEGYTLLPGFNANILTIDIGKTSGSYHYELFDSVLHTWTNYTMPFGLSGDFPSEGEIGPAIQLLDGTVFATGAATGGNTSQQPVPGKTGIYQPPPTNSWRLMPPSPSFPTDGSGYPLGLGDEMAVLLPDGNVLMSAHNTAKPGSYYFLEYQPSPTNAMCSISGAPSALINAPSSAIEMLLLPTGDVFITQFNQDNPSNGYYIYSPPPTTYSSTIRPSITAAAISLTRGTTYTLNGKRFSGVSQGSQYGDDFQNFTNYPIVRFTYSGGSPVVYLKTHDHSTMAISTGNTQTTTQVDIPSGLATGTGTLVVIANGIPSLPVAATIN
ncbi:MAG: hypothetical protein WA655_11280 [Candidatus Korobacteraceae bacterium]